MKYKKEMWLLGIIAFSFLYVLLYDNSDVSLTGMVTNIEPGNGDDGHTVCNPPDHTVEHTCPPSCTVGEESCTMHGGMICSNTPPCKIYTEYLDGSTLCYSKPFPPMEAAKKIKKSGCDFCAENTVSGNMACANSLTELKNYLKNKKEIKSGDPIKWGGGAEEGTMQKGSPPTIQKGNVRKMALGGGRWIWVALK